MGLFDDIKAAADSHEGQVEQGVDKVGDTIDSKTEGKYADKVDQAQDFLKDRIGGSEEQPQG